MHIQKIIKRTLKAGVLAVALATSSQVMGQGFTVPPDPPTVHYAVNSGQDVRFIANSDGGLNYNEGFGFYLWKDHLAMRIGHTGNVGIGIKNPEYRLQVEGTTKTNSLYTKWITNKTQNGYLRLGGYFGNLRSESVYILSDGSMGVGVDLPQSKFHVDGDIRGYRGIFNGGLSALNGSFAGGISASRATISGNLSATDGNFTSNLQAVNGTFSGDLSANRVRLNVGSFPDYVFASGYELMPLEQVEAYIKAHKHLPKVPSAAKVIKEGMNVGQMNVLLMEKVEELTLHTIEQHKQIKLLIKEVKTLKAQIKKQ